MALVDVAPGKPFPDRVLVECCKHCGNVRFAVLPENRNAVTAPQECMCGGTLVLVRYQLTRRMAKLKTRRKP